MLVYNFEGVPRNPLIVALKNVLTLGIHTKIWLYRVNREMDGREGFHINLVTLALMLWLPIVTPAVVKFQTAARLNQMVSDPVTIPLIRARRLGWVSLVPVLGAGFYAYWVQASLNRFWFWHRRKERIQMDRERIKALADAPEAEASKKRLSELQEACRRLEREMEEEIEAVRLKWGEERFLERKKRADLHVQRGRLSRKEVVDLRRKEKEKRKQEAARRRRERSLVARYRPRTADPEDDSLWEPYTPLPRRMPEEIAEAAKEEDRELTKREARELKRAEGLLSAREKESARLEKRRAKLLALKRKKEARLEAQAEKKAAGKKAKKAKKGSRSRKAGKETQQVEPEAAKGPVAPRRRLLVLPPKRDPEVDDHWSPRTPEPELDPDELTLSAEAEGRGLTKKERKRIAQAEKQLEKREKEEESLEKAREKARARAQKQQAALEEKKEKERAKAEKKRSKESSAKKGKKGKKKGKINKKAAKQKADDQDGGPKKRPVMTKKPEKTKPGKDKGKPEKRAGEGSSSVPGEVSGEGDAASLKVLKVRCPQCRTQVPVKKRDDRPARLKCPSCGLVGKV